MVRRLSTKVAMTIGLLVLVGWLSTMGAAAGIVLIVTGDAEAGVGLVTAAVITPLSYLIGRAQGLTVGKNGKRPKRTPPVS
jgi:hypothetical protein